MTSPPISTPAIATPAGFAPAFALGFADPDGHLAQVAAAMPLPVALTSQGVAAPALAGTATGAVLAGPFVPAGLSPISVTLSGEWDGSVRLRRSTDGGDALHDLRVAGLDWGVFTSNGTEQVWSESEPGASFWLDIALVSGACTYRVSQ